MSEESTGGERVSKMLFLLYTHTSELALLVSVAKDSCPPGSGAVLTNLVDASLFYFPVATGFSMNS